MAAEETILQNQYWTDSDATAVQMTDKDDSDFHQQAAAIVNISAH